MFTHFFIDRPILSSVISILIVLGGVVAMWVTPISQYPEGMGYFYADVAHDFALPRHWTMTLSLAGGHFLNGDDIGANEHLEFMSGIAFARQLASSVRLGLAGYHISNGGLAHPNNASEALVLFLAVPLDSSR